MQTTGWRALLTLVSALALGLFGLLIYAVGVSRSAKSLVDSARGIRSAADAYREIAGWRSRALGKFREEASPQNGDRNYDLQVDNTVLSSLHLAAPVMAGMTITMRGGQLRSIVLVMFSGREPATTSGVWVQEWFDSDLANGVHVNPKDSPLKATVEFSWSVPETQREKAFALNTDCIIKPGGCRSADDILPGVWQLGGTRQ